MDYEKFEGRTIKVIDYIGDEISGLIVGCDYDIGITIVNADNKNEYLSCLRGPSSGFIKLYCDSDYEYYNEMFENYIAMFNEGFYDIRIMKEIDKKYNEISGRHASSEGCAFNK